MSSSKAAPAPDYVGAAQAQGTANVDAARATGKMNNPNVNNPYGSQTVTWNGDTPTITQTLSPEQKHILDLNNWGQTRQAETSASIANGLKSTLSQPVSFDGLAQMPGANTTLSHPDVNTTISAPNANTSITAPGQINDQVVNAMMARVNTDTADQRGQADSDLAAAGIPKSSAAYAKAMRGINNQYNDARNQALVSGNNQAMSNANILMGQQGQAFNQNLSSQGLRTQQEGQQFNQGLSNAQLTSQQQQQQYGQGAQTHTQAIADYLAKRDTGLNELNALQNGSQVSSPFASGLGFQAGSSVQAAPVANAVAAQGQNAMNQYNQQQASTNSNISAGAGLLGSAAQAYGAYRG